MAYRYHLWKKGEDVLRVDEATKKSLKAVCDVFKSTPKWKALMGEVWLGMNQPVSLAEVDRQLC